MSEFILHLQSPWFAFIAAAIAAAALVALLLATGLAYRLMDVPVERSLHQAPKPRAGGLAIWGSFAILGVWFGLDMIPASLCLGLVAVFLISLADDRKALPATARLAVHAAAALLWVMSLLGTTWMVLPAVLATVWAANLFNFMDGSDGLAAGMALAGFLVLGVIAQGSNHAVAWPAFLAAGAVLGFLVFNFPPARLFMGDGGSIPLGFLAAALSLWGVHDGLWSIWVPVLAFAPFILDASATLLLRVLRGQKPWEAHREHLYQFLVLRGWSHRRLLAVAYPLMAVCTGLAWLIHRIGHDGAQLWGPVCCLSLATLYVLARMRVARPAQDAG